MIIEDIELYLLSFLTAIIWVYFAKLEGIRTLKSGLTNMYQNKLPVNEIFGGASIAIAALFWCWCCMARLALGYLERKRLQW